MENAFRKIYLGKNAWNIKYLPQISTDKMTKKKKTEK